MDSLIVLHRLAVTAQCITGVVCASLGAQHIWRLALDGAEPVLSRGDLAGFVEVMVGLVVVLPAVLVVASVPPMIRGTYIAFRSGAAASGVLLVALIGLLSLFANVLALQLCIVVISDLLLIATFGETRRRRRQSPRGLPPGL